MRTNIAMTYVDNLIEAFGGVRPMAAATGDSPSTVMSWKVRGCIPDSHKARILETGVRRGIQLREEDFFPHSQTSRAALYGEAAG